MTSIKKLGLVLASVLVMATAVCSISCSGDNTTQAEDETPVTVNLFAGAGMKLVLDELSGMYMQSKPWVTVTPNYASAGTLQAQIENGAPCDVFFAPATSFMDNLQGEGLILDNTRKNILINKVVLIVPSNSALNIACFEDLASDTITHIAIGDPKSVPAGKYAEQTFTQYGILESLQSKFVLASTVTQVLQYVDSGNVDAGIVYATDALSNSNVKVVATGPDEVNAKILYPITIVKASADIEAAQAYIDFLCSEEAMAVFERYGYAEYCP
jgi:molybdate transport system substrate-binding protein